MNYTKPQISVIIPTINREKYLFSTLKDLNNQFLKNIEVIIIDQNKKINFIFYKNLEKKLKNLKILLFYQYVGNSSAARNLGVANSRSNIVLFLILVRHLGLFRFLLGSLEPLPAAKKINCI